MPKPKRSERAYGLFEKVDGKYVRIVPSLYGTKNYMVRVCQDALLAYFYGACKYPRELRPLGNLAIMRQLEWDAMFLKSKQEEPASK